MKKTIDQINQEIDNTQDKANALRYALRLVTAKNEEARYTIENVPNNIYIEDWKLEEKRTAKYINAIEETLLDLAKHIDVLFVDLENAEKRTQNLAQSLKEQAKKEPTPETPKKANKGYVIKQTLTNLENNNKQVYFMGVDGYIQDDIRYCEPYKRKGNALKRIEKDAKFQKGCFGAVLVNDMEWFDDTWHTVNELIEVEL